MKKPSDSSDNSEELRKNILGMGDNSLSKSYFPSLKKRMAELERYHALLDQTNDGIALLSIPELVITEENLTARNLLPSLERNKTSFYSLLKNQEYKNQIKVWLENKKNSDSSISFSEFDTAFSQPERKILKYTLTKVSFKSEQAITLVIRDITKQKKIEEDLRQAQKMDAIGQLAGGIAHDFNNSLTAIVNAAELICMKWNSENELKQFAEIILKAADNASALTSKLLTFSRKEEGDFQLVDLHQVLNDSIEILKHTVDRRISIKVDLKAENMFVYGDYSQLQSSLINLGINARDSMKDSGSVIFSTEECYLSQEFCSESQFPLIPGKYILLSVEDSGDGIESDILNIIFDPFFTTKERGKGTGLGLATVYGTVKDHNGAITVYSEKGVGTCFNIYLPLKKITSLSNDSGSDFPSVTGTVLLADDDTIILSTAKKMLIQLGLKVIESTNGKESLELFKKHYKEIDLVILDEIMPVLSGVDAFKRIRKINNKTPVIFSSGFSLNKERELLLKEGGCFFIKKPFRFNELKGIVVKVLG